MQRSKDDLSTSSSSNLNTTIESKPDFSKNSLGLSGLKVFLRMISVEKKLINSEEEGTFKIVFFKPLDPKYHEFFRGTSNNVTSH